MTARNNGNSFPYFFQVSLPVSKCPDSVSKADKKLYVEKDFTAELASVLPTFPRLLLRFRFRFRIPDSQIFHTPGNECYRGYRVTRQWN